MGRKPRSGKQHLRRSIQSSQFHNRRMEEDQMWASRGAARDRDERRPSERERERGPGAATRRSPPPPGARGALRMDQRRLQESRPRRPAERRRPELDSAMRRARRDGQQSMYWTKKLLDFEERDPDRWGHSGFRELYMDGGGSAAPAAANGGRTARSRERRDREPRDKRDQRDPRDSRDQRGPRDQRDNDRDQRERDQRERGQRERERNGDRRGAGGGERGRRQYRRRPSQRRSRSRSRSRSRGSRSRSGSSSSGSSYTGSSASRSRSRSPGGRRRHSSSSSWTSSSTSVTSRSASPNSRPAAPGAAAGVTPSHGLRRPSPRARPAPRPPPPRPAADGPRARPPPIRPSGGGSGGGAGPSTSGTTITRRVSNPGPPAHRTSDRPSDHRPSDRPSDHRPSDHRPSDRPERSERRRRSPGAASSRRPRAPPSAPATAAAPAPRRRPPAASESPESSSSSAGDEPARTSLSERFGRLAQLSSQRGASELVRLKIVKDANSSDKKVILEEEPGGVGRGGGERGSPERVSFETEYREYFGQKLRRAAVTDDPGADLPRQLPRDWETDVSVRYRYYRDAGYFRDHMLTLEEYIKWEQWWYRYREWLAKEARRARLERPVPPPVEQLAAPLPVRRLRPVDWRPEPRPRPLPRRF